MFGERSLGGQMGLGWEDDLAARLGDVRAWLQVGAVFMLPDAWTGRTDAAKCRPAVLVRPVKLEGPPELVLRAPVRVALRSSWKPHFGPMPTDEAPRREWLTKVGWVFTPAGLLPRLNRAGLFEIRRLWPVPLERLIAAEFVGWLPLPYIASIAAITAGTCVADPYPPSAE